MARALRFAAALVVGLGLLTLAASLLVHRNISAWFEKDTRLRSQLAVNGARQSIVAHWNERRPEELRGILSSITHDERIMGAAACSASLRLVAKTSEFPSAFGCSEIGEKVRARRWKSWHEVSSLPGGSVHISAVPIRDQGRPLGLVILVHDLSFVERRDAKAREFLLFAFGFLAVAASAVTLMAARWSWRNWNEGLRRLLRGETARPEFRPFVRDVRELVDRIVTEKEADREAGVWTPERLKGALNRYLHGERVVIVANREPYVHSRGKDGRIDVLHPASGLVTALEPVMRACSGVWIAHGSGSADRETVDSADRVRVPPGDESYVLRRVWLSPEEEKGYYYGFANEGLWPLCHLAHARPIFRGEDWRHYRKVNEKFAEAVCAEVDSDDPIVLVQDYHFALVPRFIRQRLPRATVLMFWHIPWPNSERFAICPWHTEILDGMLGSSIVGFHTQLHGNNFLDSVDRILEARVDRGEHAVVRSGSTSLVRAYPISLEWPSRWLATVPSVSDCRRTVLADLGLPHDAILGVGVDRLDYTKGIEERFLAVERLLERSPKLCGRFTFVQLAAPSRSAIDRYKQLDDQVEHLVARINERFGSDGYRPIRLLKAHHEPPTVFRYYRAADVCYVSSLHDGMNLVAKEFVSARDDERGVLVLSEFTGASRELTEALIVNPYDLDEASAALAAAIDMPQAEQRDRMRAMRDLVSDFNVYRWAGKMIIDAAKLRRRERLSGRLGDVRTKITLGGTA